VKKNRIWLIILIIIVAVGLIWFFYDGGSGNLGQGMIDTADSTINDITDETFAANGSSDTTTNIGANTYVRNTNTVDFSTVKSTPWDISEASTHVEPQDKRPYTIMVYMIGSNLESEDGSASSDIQEMLNSQVNSENANVIIMTGGAKTWKDFGIPSDCSLIQVKDGQLYLLDTIGMKDMGDPGTLSSFIDFSMENFPADKYGLIMWDHGGGSIYGFGYDENFKGDGLTLLEMNQALESSDAKNTRFEFIGFDACLMASVEMSAVASDYANYLIGSEDVEPGYGWDYAFLSSLNNTGLRGDAIGQSIVDTSMKFYDGYDVDVTLSVIDLGQVDYVLGAMDNMMNQCENDLNSGTVKFSTFSKKRAGTKTFGTGSPRDNCYDMVDLGDMASKLKDLYPGAANEMENALSKAVVYNKYTAQTDSIHGLTGYYIYGQKDRAEYAINTYESLKMSNNYTEYQKSFASDLTGTKILDLSARSIPMEENSSGDYYVTLSQDEISNLVSIDFTVWEKVPDPSLEDYYFMIGMQSGVTIDENGNCLSKFSGIWPGAAGYYACLYEISDDNGAKTYAIPAQLNGKNVDIIALYNETYPNGKILGARNISEDTNSSFQMAQRGLTTIKDGDEVAFCYFAQYLGPDPENTSHEWYVGESFTVNGELTLQNYKASPGDVYLYGFKLTDSQRNESYSDFIEVDY